VPVCVPEPAVLEMARQGAQSDGALVEVPKDTSEPHLAVQRSLQAFSGHPILLVAADARGVMSALAAGADDAVEVADFTADSCAEAVRRARCRAVGRTARQALALAHARSQRGELGDVLGWMAHQLAGSLSTAELDAELLERVLPRVARVCTTMRDRARDGRSLSSQELTQLLSAPQLASLGDAEEIAGDLLHWMTQVEGIARDLKRVWDLFQLGPTQPIDVHRLLAESLWFVGQNESGAPDVTRDLAADSCRVLASKAQLAEVLCTLCLRAVRSARTTKSPIRVTPIRVTTRSDAERLHVEWHVEGAPPSALAHHDEPLAASMESVRQLGGQLSVARDEARLTFELGLPLTR